MECLWAICEIYFKILFQLIAFKWNLIIVFIECRRLKSIVLAKIDATLLAQPCTNKSLVVCQDLQRMGYLIFSYSIEAGLTISSFKRGQRSSAHHNHIHG